MQSYSPEQIDAIKSNADTAMAFSNIVLSSFEHLINLNLSTTRTLLEESAAATSLMLESGNSTSSTKAQKAIPETATQNAMAYFQEVQELTTETQQELTQLMTSYFSAHGHGANPSAAWLKGFDGVFKSLGHQVSAITEANHKAMADVTSRVAKATASQSAKHA
ncbi:phasin family protein [Dechloromonas sp. A34]|uniref:phasin family protein n=1 Tax=Dechloromonas sp. A34 TaxID=447588 RepID=UPI0022497FF2|nr:phasin family protein [Dechloromonas sp. A34]